MCSAQRQIAYARSPLVRRPSMFHAVQIISVLALLCPSCTADGISIPLREIAKGVSLPVISIGTWLAGTKEDPFSIVGNWTAQGGRGIDTALVYRDQAKVAAAIRAQWLRRDEVYITSKIPFCAGEALAKIAIEEDLKALNTTYVDLMLIHTSVGVDCPGTWRALEKYHAAGALRSIGVSNFKPAALQPLLEAARVPVAVNQIDYSVLSHDEETIAFCRAHDITVEAYSPLGGAYSRGSIFSEPTVVAIANAHGVSAAQVAIRWIVQGGPHPHPAGDILTVLSGNPEHQLNDADVFGFQLSDAEMQNLTKISSAKKDSPTIFVE